MLERVTESGLVIPEPFLEAFDDELEIPEAFLLAFPAAKVTGPRVTLVGDPVTEAVVVRFVWNVQNLGTAQGRAGLRVNLQIDAALGDFSQLIMETDQTLAGALRLDVVDITATTPVDIPAGTTRALYAELHIPVSAMLGRQGSVAGFNWWIAELTAWDEDTGAMLKCPDGSDARYEVRDWFKVSAVPAARLVAAAEASYFAYITSMELGP